MTEKLFLGWGVTMRRYVLGPVILCVLIIGLVGVDFGQAAQARTTGKKEARSVASTDAKAQKKAPEGAKVALEGKKVSSAKRKVKSKHASAGGNKNHRKTSLAKGSKKATAHRHVHAKTRAHAHAHLSARAHSSKPLAHINHVADYDLPAPLPSDLLLAKSCPDFDTRMANGLEPDGLTMKILGSAYSCLGSPYRRGGTSPGGFDCSGFIKYVFRENGIQLGRSSRDQALEGKPVPLSELKPGDLIFFKMHQRKRARSHIDHVGLYIGNGQFIHASNNPRSHEIKIDDLEREYFFPKVVGARRILDEAQ